jgi:hypothetical protein
MHEYDPANDPDPAAWLQLDEPERIEIVQLYHERTGFEGPSVHIHAVIHSIVETQLAANDPTEVRATVDRLIAEGLDRHEAIHAVGAVVATQVFELAKNGGEGADPNEAYRRKLADVTASGWRALSAATGQSRAPSTPRTKIEPDQAVPVRITARQKELLFEEIVVDPDYAERLRPAEGSTDFVGEFTLDDLEDILGYVAAVANHTDDGALEEELDQLHEHLQRTQRSYDDGNW